MTGMKLIEKDDPQYFQVSSDKPYDRHIYRLHLSDGRYRDFNDYEELQITWFENPKMFLDRVEILDVKAKPKGF